jgi:nitronate monooxygenase
MLFGIDLPIVLGPMSGGPSTPELVAAVSNAGGLGSLGEGYASPEQIAEHIRSVRSQCGGPFAVNLFVPAEITPDETAIERALQLLAPYRDELGLPPQSPPTDFAEDFVGQIEAVRSERVPVFTFTFGVLAENLVDDLHRGGTVVGGTATTPPKRACWPVPESTSSSPRARRPVAIEEASFPLVVTT